jgi:hypothetical protein
MKTKQKTSIFAISAIVAMFAVVGVAGIPESSAIKSVTYEVTITNLTPGQPITPPLLVTHGKDAGFFSVGEEASPEIKQLAENGNTEPLVNKLKGVSGVIDVVQGTAPLVPANDPGETGLNYSETFQITAEGTSRYLSFASMLVCTNDGFAGIDSVKLPYYTEKTIYAMAYDARTEMNTEDFVDMVPPCQGAIGISSDDEGTGTSNPALEETGVIIPHTGIMGGEDLLREIHDWENPVVKIDVVRVK